MRFFIMLLFVAGWSFDLRADSLQIGEKASYDIQVARTPHDLAKGLMFVRTLPENEGMLFDLRGYPKTAMWMKNTYIALDMLFIGCDFYIVDIYENAEPLSLRKIKSKRDFCYVLEINGGQVQKRHIALGDKIVWQKKSS